jgi:two-component system sensor histidine kinase PilS (NtrC family)
LRLAERTDPRLRAILTPQRVLAWLYVGRLSLASAIFIAAVFVWNRAGTDPRDLLVASLAFAVSAVVTGGSYAWSEIYRRPLRPTFLYLQAVYDLLLVTAIVHVTGGSGSQFTALYILVIVSAALLLPAGGTLLVAALGNVLYIADAIWGHPGTPGASLWLQLGVFALVALFAAWVSARLQEAGAGKAELQAELKRERLRAADILRNIRSGIVTVDADGHLLFANPAAGHLLGFDATAMIGEPVLDRIQGASPALADVLVHATRDGSRVTRGEGTIHRDGERFPIGVTTTYTDPDFERADGSGRGRTATAIFSDISEQKRYEAVRIRAERLEGVAALSASLAHEIKNPLAAVRSAVEQLSRMPHVSEDERVLSALVLRESDRLSRLLSEFLDFARVRVTRTTHVDVAEVARGAATLAATHPDLPEGATVSCQAAGDDLAVEGDEDLVHRAVFNLALNAVQAVPPGGRVTVEVFDAPPELAPASLGMHAGAVAIRVTDDGPGIDAEARDRLFDPFFTTKPGGTGLGLAVVQRAVEAHRGFVLVDQATPAGGTQFTVVLPRAE